MSLLIVGCGYVGRSVAKRWLERGEPVAAVTRGGEAVKELTAIGVQPIVADWLNTESAWPCNFVPTRVLVAVPHRADERHGVQSHCIGLANVLRRFGHLKRIVVLSTTGVYHQCDGQWVDEESPTEPTRIGPQIALQAELWLEQNVAKDRAISLRLAGIYGPQRIPLLAKLRSKEPIPIAAGWLNLIHLDDITTAIVRLLKRQSTSSRYVLSDGQPVERRQFYIDAAQIFHTAAPNFVAADPETSRAARSESNKRINSIKILRELDLELRYPDYRAGLQSLALRSH